MSHVHWVPIDLFSALQPLSHIYSPILSLLGVSGSMEHTCHFPPFRADISWYLDHFDHFYYKPSKIHDLRIVELKLYECSGAPADKCTYAVVTVQDVAGTIYHFRTQGRQMQLFGEPEAPSANLNTPSEDTGASSSESAPSPIIISIRTVRYPKKRVSDSLVGTLTLPTGDAALPLYWYHFVFIADTMQKSFHDNRLFAQNRYGVAGALMRAMEGTSNVAVVLKQGCAWDSLVERERTLETERFIAEYSDTVGKFEGMLESRMISENISKKFEVYLDALHEKIGQRQTQTEHLAEIRSAMIEDADKFLDALEKEGRLSRKGVPTQRDVERIRAEIENLVRLSAP